MPPFLLLHGTKDEVVALDQSVMMCAAMKKAGNSCELFTVEGAGHGINGAEWKKQIAYQTKMVEWLRKTLGKT